MMDIASLMQSMSLETQEGSNLTKTALIINGNHTEIVIGRFTQHLMIICTQYEKIGGLYRVFVDNVKQEDGQDCEPIYTVRKLLGTECEEAFAASRFIAEKLKIREQLDCFLALKSYDVDTVRKAAEALSSIIANIK